MAENAREADGVVISIVDPKPLATRERIWFGNRVSTLAMVDSIVLDGPLGLATVPPKGVSSRA